MLTTETIVAVFGMVMTATIGMILGYWIRYTEVKTFMKHQEETQYLNSLSVQEVQAIRGYLLHKHKQKAEM
jgi:hypothetical protein